MGQFGGFGPTLNTVDELRIATTFIDALPELPLPGDTDGDRDVDLDDYNNIITHLGLQVGTALEGDVAKADGTQGSDGRVTIADYRIWKDHYPTLAQVRVAVAIASWQCTRTSQLAAGADSGHVRRQPWSSTETLLISAVKRTKY